MRKFLLLSLCLLSLFSEAQGIAGTIFVTKRDRDAITNLQSRVQSLEVGELQAFYLIDSVNPSVFVSFERGTGKVWNVSGNVTNQIFTIANTNDIAILKDWVQNTINSTSNSLSAAITNESALRESGTNLLWTALTNESALRASGTNLLWIALTNESALRISGTNSLWISFTNTLWNAMTNEANLRIAGDNALWDGISAEAALRISGTNALWIALTNEAALRISGTNTLNIALTNESALRISGTNVLWQGLTNESALRISGTNTLNIALTNESALRISGTNTLNIAITNESALRISGTNTLWINTTNEMYSKFVKNLDGKSTNLTTYGLFVASNSTVKITNAISNDEPVTKYQMDLLGTNLLNQLVALSNEVYYVSPTVSWVSSGSGLYELGSSLSSVNLSFTVNKPMITRNYSDSYIETLGAGSDYSTNLTTTINSTRTYTITVTDSHPNSASSSQSFTFLNRKYYGASTFTNLTNARVLTLTTAWEAKGHAITSPDSIILNNQYIYVVYPKRYGTCTSFSIGGFGTSPWPLTEQSVTNTSGYVETFYIYRSASALTTAGTTYAVQ